MAKMERASADYSSIDDLSLPRGASAALFRNEHSSILERSNSDSNLNMLSPQSWSSLSVDKTAFVLRGPGRSHDARVRVEWDIKEDVGAQDWIGLFNSGETNTSKFLDCKTRGSSGGARGTITWDLDAIEHLFSELKTVVCFKYISGTTEDVLATSPVITVSLVDGSLKSPKQLLSARDTTVDQGHFRLTLEDVHANNLKKGMFFNPDPYLKLQVLPHNPRDRVEEHHYQKQRSAVVPNTANPSWEAQKFSLKVFLSDLLEIEVKHKFSKSRPTMSRFLGRITIPLQTIMDRISAEQKAARFTLELMRKSPSDNVSGSIEFKANLHLLLRSLDTDSNKANGVLHRQSSLPSPLQRVDDLSLQSSHIRHRHTDPGLAAMNSLDVPSPRSCIKEEPIPNSLILTQTDNSSATSSLDETEQGAVADIVKNQDSLPDTESGSQFHLKSHLNSLDSGTSLSVICSNETSGESAEQDNQLCTPSGDTSEPHGGHLPGSFQNVQSDSGQSKSIPLLSNGMVASGGVDVEPISGADLDMTVQSAGSPGLNFLKSDAPLLPPRTYRVVAPPLPPRIQKTSAPPLPPRPLAVRPVKKVPPASSPHGTDHVRKIHDAPPPLPPRTYSPNECREGEAGDVFDTIHIVDSRSLREQELFPWGPPSPPISQSSTLAASSRSPAAHPSPNLVPGTSQHHSASTTRPNPLISRTDQSATSAHLAFVPLADKTVIPASAGHNGGSARPGIDDLAGSRGSIALSTVSEPPAIGSLQSSVASQKRRSVDGLSQIKALVPPRLQPRQRQLSSEERQQNRQQINQQLEQWTRKCKKTSNTPKPSSPDEQSSPPSFNECQEASARERLSPPLPQPRSSPPAGASSHRQADNVDSHTAIGPSSGSSSQVPTTSLTPAARDRSHDGGIQGADGGEPPRKRPIKYHRVDDRDDALPSGWEARVDSHGRIFYIDHVNRTTTWQRPQTGQQSVQRRPTLSSEQRQQLDRRYQSIRRTITQQNHQADTESVSSGDSNHLASGATNVPDNSPSLASPSEPATDRSERSVYKFPAVKFLTRPDFFPMLQVNENAMVEYNRTSKLKHMITKIRRDPQTFERYQHNRDLVAFVNLFCDTSKELPRRWEMKYDKTGKAFFIDHVLRTTTFMDPRLPTDVPLIDPHFLQTPPPRPPPPPPAIPTAYNEKVVLFLRQPNVDEILRERCPQYASSSSLREKVNKVAARGVEMLERFSNDIDLTLLLSLFENEIMSYVPIANRIEAANPMSPQGSPVPRIPGRVPAPYKRDFQAKLRSFYRKIESKGYGQGPGKLKLTVRRDHVLEDAFNKIMSTPKKELQKNKLYITFAGEEGLDYGGPSREFFFLLSRELFNPYYGLFEYSANDTYTVQVSPLSTFVENAHEWFRFSGRVLGLALVHQYLLDAFFTRPFYKALLRVPLSLEDVESLDMEFHQSLLWIKDNDISEVELDLTFSVSEEVFGQVTERELKPNGKNIIVTERNKKEYIEKMVKWRLERGVTEQTESLIRGFHEVLDARLVSVFDARELELVIAGTVEIDIGDWRRNTDYRSGYHDQHPVIQWFWEAIEKFDNERQLRLLQFVTGSSSIPYEGFSALRGSNGPRKFCIEKWGKVTSLPRAHTCFNRLDLPPYTSSEMLFEKLVMAVEETSTFGID
ncbi:unnamed protein product [Lymnaea stagnalis]|uniref:HECT-type E3 ubiquitin transferase n=1 Tax=Lymnaea stagnalis TaxID=6523 RepID=A0AAV2GX69_LYMST